MRGLKFNLQQTKDWPDISNGRQKDFEALRSDWENVGTYIQKGTKRAAVAAEETVSTTDKRLSHVAINTTCQSLL